MMGKFGGIILILILLMWCCNTRKTVVEFNLIGSSGVQPELVVNGEEREIEVDDSGYAKLMLTEGEHGYATLKYGKDRLPLFIEDGTTLRIYIYGDHAKGNIRFEGFVFRLRAGWSGVFRAVERLDSRAVSLFGYHGI